MSANTPDREDGFEDGRQVQREVDATLVQTSEADIASAIAAYLRAGYGEAEAGIIAAGVCSDLAAAIRRAS
jgi:hypothetical protein